MKELINLYKDEQVAKVVENGLAYHRFLKNGWSCEEPKKAPAKKTTRTRKKKVDENKES